MSTVADEGLKRYVLSKIDDPDTRAELRILAECAASVPKLRQELEGRIHATRYGLRCVLALRGFELSDEERTRIEACGDLETLLRWLKQAVLVGSAAEALQ